MIILKLNSFLQLIALLFALKAVLGILIFLLGWQATIAGWAIPSWLMVTGIVADALLAGAAINFVKK